MSWLKSKSYSLKVGKGKQPVEKMDVILKGILSSPHPDSMKRSLLQKIAEKGATTQPSNVIIAVLDLTTKWYLDGNSELENEFGLSVFLSWAKHNLSTFEHFFNKEFLTSLMSKKYRNESKVPLLLGESMRVLQMTSMYRSHCSVIEAKAIGYVREHPYLECLKNFTDFIMEFRECIPKGDLTLPFCTNMIHSLSICNSPEEEGQIVNYIKSVNTIASLLADIWNNTDSQTVLNCLKVIFSIISSSCELEPSICLGSLVQYLPQTMISIVVKQAINDSSIDNARMITAIQRIIDWLQWPTSKFVDEWVIAFLKGLASVQKYSILITVTENKVDQIFEKLQFGPVREPGFSIISHMLLSFQHCPDPFHKILPMVPKIVGLLKGDDALQSKQLMGRLAELLHILMYLHAGFPELYDPVYECIKEYSKPSPDVIKFKLLESKWTAHRDGKAYVPRSYQQKAEMGKTGLYNLGNTCYMNSILQSLYMCDSFRNGVLQHTPTPEQALIVKLQYVFAFLSHSQRPAYAPINFLAASRPAWFMSGFQQDCSEFLKYFLDQLHEQESSYISKSSLKSSQISPKSSQSSNKSSHSNGHDSSVKQRTLIEESFGGKMATTYTCLNCGKESASEEMFMDLPLAFPEYQASSYKSLAGGDSKMSTRSTNPQPSTSADSGPSEERNCLHLNDLLKHYLNPEKLDGDNKYHCDQCGGLQDGERKIKIVETPSYLILTLLRFSYDTKLHSRSKIFREVKYPKTLLVPVEDESHRATRRERKDSLRSSVADQLERCGVDMDVDCADIYSLCSVVIHSGTSSDCGHYYCYARHSVITNGDMLNENIQNCSNEDDIDFLQDKWYLFNDNRVSYASYSSFSNVTQRFTKDTAYVLVYRKINPENLQVEQKISPDVSIQPTKMDAPLRPDLRKAVGKDNKSFLQEQENAAGRNTTRKRPNDSSWYNWKDDDDKGGSGSFGGGLGDLDTSGARFVF